MKNMVSLIIATIIGVFVMDIVAFAAIDIIECDEKKALKSTIVLAIYQIIGISILFVLKYYIFT